MTKTKYKIQPKTKRMIIACVTILVMLLLVFIATNLIKVDDIIRLIEVIKG
jgi:hypothetical protein